jgi:glutaredoxin 3
MSEPRYTLYQFDACPYCTMVRRRMGELGLTFTVVTVPHVREERRAVYEVSGQYLVPTLVIEEDQRREVLTDENDILAYLDRRYGPRPGPADQGLPGETREHLRQVVADAERHAEVLQDLAGRARHDGREELANVLAIAERNLREVSSWVGRRLDEV